MVEGHLLPSSGGERRLAVTILYGESNDEAEVQWTNMLS